MAKPNPLLVLLLVPLSLLPWAKAISEPEPDAAISALRSRGYHLFGNAITTSDVRLELLSNASYTLFAPTDAALFSLDMASSSVAYVHSLRCHVALDRLPLSALRSLPSGASLRTLLPYCDVFISHRQSPDADFVTADGVDIVLPGLFYGQNVAVHGLAGILTVYRKRFPAGAIPPASRPPDLRSSPSIAPVSRLPPSRAADPLPDHHTHSSAPDSSLSPFGSADPPDLWTPVGSPTVDLSPVVAIAQAPVSFSPEAAPPFALEDYYPPMQSGVVAEVPSGISSVVDMGSAAPIPSEIVFPGGKQGEGISVVSPAAATPAVTIEFSSNDGAFLEPRDGREYRVGGFGHETRSDAMEANAHATWSEMTLFD